MRRIILLLTVAALIAATVVVTAVPGFAQGQGGPATGADKACAKAHHPVPFECIPPPPPGT